MKTYLVSDSFDFFTPMEITAGTPFAAVQSAMGRLNANYGTAFILRANAEHAHQSQNPELENIAFRVECDGEAPLYFYAPFHCDGDAAGQLDPSLTDEDMAIEQDVWDAQQAIAAAQE